MLPGDKTVVYVHVDLGTSLDQMNKSLTFIDPETGGKLAAQVKELYAMGLEVAKSYEFKPALLDHVGELDLYLVVLAMDKPEEISHTTKTPKLNKDTMEPVPGEFDEQVSVERHQYAVSLVVRTPSEEMAADFVQQYKALLGRQKEKHPDVPGLEQTDIKVDKGQLVGQKDGGVTVGCLGDMVVVSSGNPKELWAALMAPPEKKLADSAAYQKLMAGAGGSPEVIGMANVGAFIHQAEAALKGSVDAAAKGSAEGAGQDAQDPAAAAAAAGQAMAQMFYNLYETFQKLFSLDKLEWAGGSASFTTDADHCVSTSYIMLSHGEPISPLLQEMLSGSGAFQPPAIGKADSMCVLVRVDVGRIINEVLQSLSDMGGPIGMQLQQGLAGMKAQLGVGLDDLLKLPAGDTYVYIDFTAKDVEQSKQVYDDKTQQWTENKTKVHVVTPDLTVLLGLRDANAARDTIGGLVTRLSAEPNTSEVVNKRTFKDTDVYCFGPGMADPANQPDGKTSFAIAIVDRYLAFGSWDDVTKAVTQLAAAQPKTDAALMAVVKANPDANFLVVVPKAAQMKSQQVMANMEGQQNAFAMMAAGLQTMHLGLEDQKLEGRIKTGLEELIKDYQALVVKAAAVSPDVTIMKGAPAGDYYEISSKTDLKK